MGVRRKIYFYRYNSICEPDVIDVLTRLGNAVTEGTEEMVKKDLTPGLQARILIRALQGDSFDAVFTINYFPTVSQVCRILKLPYAAWIVDSPVLELYSPTIQNTCNRIFMFDYAMYQEFYPRNPEGIFYLPLGADHTRIDEVIASITDGERNRFSADVSFVGSLYTEKCPYNRLLESPDQTVCGKQSGEIASAEPEPDAWMAGYLEGLIEAQLKVYGYNFLPECVTEDMAAYFRRKLPDAADMFDGPSARAVIAHLYLGNKVTEQERLRLLRSVSERFSLDLYTGSDTSSLPEAHNCGLAKSMTEMPKIFHLSKINLNFTSKPIQTGLPQRIWDILAAGGFVLSNYQSEIPEYFEVGKDLEVYTSGQELLEKISYYLEHEDERIQIAENGSRKAKEKYSLESKVRVILSLL